MRTRRRTKFFGTLASILCFFSICLPNFAPKSNDNEIKPVEATSGLNLRLVGNIEHDGTGWNNTNSKWVFTETSSGVYEIKQVYMIAYDNDSNFRIVRYGEWNEDYGYPKLSNGKNEPGFTAAAANNNIHITKTGYYDIKLYDSESKIDITVSQLTLTGNIKNDGSGWSTTPNSGNWKLTKSNNMDYYVKHVYMVSHSEANFRIIPWGWSGGDWPTNIGYIQLSNGNNNAPGFTATGDDKNNIHITKTGMYNIYLWWHNDKNDWAIDIHYDDDQKTDLECQMYVDGTIVSNPTGFNYTFVYNNSWERTYSSLSNKVLTDARCGRLFYVKAWSCPAGYEFHDYRIGYTGNTTSYTEEGSSSVRNAVTHYETGTRNYIIVYFISSTFTITLNNQSATNAGTKTIYEKYSHGYYSNAGATSSISTITKPTKTGYTFGGYYTQTGGGGTQIINASGNITAANTQFTANTTIYAKWTANTYSITYKDKGNTSYSGDNAESLPTSRTYGTTLNLVDGSKTGYIFDGWYENSACTGSKVTSIAGTIIGDKTLYAKFVKRPSFASGFVIIGNSIFNQSSGIGGTSSSPAWEYFASTQEMDDPTIGTQQAAIQRVQLASGSEFKHAYYDGSTVSPAWNNTGLVSEDSSWSGTYLTAGDSTNAQVKAAGNNLYYDAFVGGDNKLYVTPSHLDVHMKGVFIRGETTVIEPTDLTPASPIYGVALYKQTYTAPTSSWSYTYSGVTYTFGGWYTDSTLTTPYVSTDNVTSDITIYAKFDDLNNYLTYDHNDGSGTRQLVDPSHIDVSQDVLSYSDLGWSDSFFRSFANWNTASDGRGTTYNLGESIKVTDTTTLYAQQSWHQVYISIDDGRTWNSTIKSAETPSGTQIQYETEQKLVVDSDYARIKIKYRNVNTGVETILENGDIDFEGYNYNAETGGVNVSFTDNIFLKVTNSNTLQCYIPGATQRTLIIRHVAGGETAVAMYRDTDDQWKSNDHEVYVRKGDKIWVKYETGSAYKSYCLAETYDGFERDTTDGNIAKCTITGAYTIYLQKGSTGEWKDIVVGTRDETKSAAYFARIFNREMCAICDNYDTNTVASFIDAWQENETENAVAVFNELSSTCQTGLKGTAYDSDLEVAEFKLKYDYILGKYGYGTGDDELHDFLGRTPARGAYSKVSTLSLLGDDENRLSNVIIISASSISLLSVVALSLLVMKKKRKED